MLRASSLLSLFVGLFATACATTGPGVAVGGAATLPQGKFAVVADFQTSASRPHRGLGLNLQYGIIDELDIDFGVGSMPDSHFFWRAGAAFQPFCSSDQTHSLAVRFSAERLPFDTEASPPRKPHPSMATASGEATTLSPSLAYEIRVGRSRGLGLYLEAGTSHFLFDVQEGSSFLYSSTFAVAFPPEPPSKEHGWSHVLRGALGIQSHKWSDGSVGIEIIPAYSFDAETLYWTPRASAAWIF
jgi:hypothetical protein